MQRVTADRPHTPTMSKIVLRSPRNSVSTTVAHEPVCLMRPYSAWLDINNEHVEAYSVLNERPLFTLVRRRCSYCARGNRQSMGRTSTDLLLDEGAQPLSDESAFDLAQYTLQQVRRDA